MDLNKKILAIYGSPRQNGNTSTLMDKFLEGIENSSFNNYTVNKVFASKVNVSPCRECRVCSKTGECVVKDEMQDIFKLFIEADFIAIASPIFFTTVSGYLKAIIDRCQRFWSLKYEHRKNIFTKEKNGIFISCAGSGAKDIFECSKKVIRSLFDVVYANYYLDFLYNNIDFKGDILKNKNAMNEIYNFGKSKKFENLLKGVSMNKKLSFIFFVALIIISIIFIGCSNAKAENPDNDLTYKNNFTLENIDDEEISLSDFKGKLIVLNFWATWCPPCKAEIPDFVETYNEYKEKGVEFVGVSMDSKSDLRQFIQAYDINYTLLIDGGQVSKQWGIRAVPATFILGRNGEVLFKNIGLMEKSKLVSEIEKRL